jgi:GDP-L-fucose synthase
VLPALIRKFHDAKVGAGANGTGGGPVTLWGTGAPLREFLYVEDVGRAITFCLRHVRAADVPDGLLNVGCGEDLTIRELADIVQRTVGYEGPVLWDDSRPDGTPRKLMDVTRIRSLGWAPEVSLEDGIRRTYDWYLEHRA